jgi:hypothetical protein
MFRIVFIAGCKIINVKRSNAMTKLTKKYLSLQSGVFLMLISFTITAAGSDSRLILRSGFTSPDAISVTVTCQVTLSSGESPEGALLTLTGVNNPALYHEQLAPESGEVIFTGVIEANYRLRAVLQGYYELDTLITILDNRLIPVFLQEIMNNPRNLSVDSLSLCVRWQAPVPAYAGLIFRQPEIMKTGNKTPVLQSKKSDAFSGKHSFTGYGVFLDGLLVGNTPDTNFVFEPLIYGQSYLAGVAAIYSSGYSEIDTCRFTSRFLFPPRNISGETPAMTDYCHITWEAPEDPQNPGLPVPGIIGYRIYRNQVFIAYIPSDTNEYYDLNLVPVNYSYHVTAVYDLTPYGFDGQTGESMTTDPVDVSVIYGYELPFVENFNTGLFETNQWTVEGNNNWRISGQGGNPAPSAEFFYSPPVLDYSLSLTSFYIIANDIIDGNIMLDFDLKHDDVNATGKETMLVEIFNGYSWVTVATYISEGDKNWETQTIDMTNAAKGNIFRVRFTAKGDNTLDIFNWMIDNIQVYRSCAPPLEFTASVYFPIEGVLLEWESPFGNTDPAWLGWDNGTNYDALGLQDGGTFHVAVRFTPAQLAQYVGTSLTKIRIFPYGSDGTFVLKVWKGVNAGILVHTQPIAAYIPGQWNEFELDTPVLVDGTSELWFGYEVSHTGNNNVAGYDEGPAVAGFGDMISLDGSGWESMATAYSLNFNWNLQGFVEWIGGDGKFIEAANEAGNSKQSHRGFGTQLQRELLGYKIYRDGVYVATTNELSYFDHCSAIPGGYVSDYDIKAIYEDCESELVSTYIWWFICPPIGVSYELIEDLKIYPNPSTGLFYVDAEGLEGKLSVYSFSGKHLLETPISKNEKPVLSLEHFPVGAYLLKFVADSGETFTGKVIIAR